MFITHENGMNIKCESKQKKMISMQTNSLSYNAGIFNSNSHNSSFSWSAVIAGAVASTAMAFILLILGFGLGLSVISPWVDAGISAAAIGISTIIWLSVSQIIASGLGGYLAGRLRTKWVNLYHDEVFFQDTAHGLVSWAVATLIAILLITSVIGTVISGGVKATASMTGGAAQSAVDVVSEMGTNQVDYFIDSLLRNDSDLRERNVADVRTELSTIMFRGLMHNGLSDDDKRYAAQVVASYTGLTPQQAQRRVIEGFERIRQTTDDADAAAKEAAEIARQTAAYSALWVFISLLWGAFSAGLMAVIGGNQRDHSVLQTEHRNDYETF